MSGKRKRYFNPLSYLLLASALYVLTTHFFGLNTFASEVIAGYGTGISDNATAEYDYSSNPVLNLLTTLADNHTLFLLITLPLFSLSSYLAFRGAGYSYLEHVVINMLITSQQMFIYLVLSAVIVEGTLSEVLPILFGVAFNTWAFFTLCVSYRRITRLLRALLIYAIYAAQTIAVLVLLSQFAAV